MRLGVTGVASVRPPDATIWSLDELVFRAVREALADANIERDAIDGVCLGASDQLDGRLISSMLLAGPAGGYLRDEVKVGDDGLGALAAAVLRLEAAVSRRVLVVSWTKASEGSPDAADAVVTDPVFERSVGLHPLASEAMAASRFLHAHGLGVGALDAVAGCEGGGEYAAWPLRSEHLCPPTDGAVAVVLEADQADVNLTAFDWVTDHPSPAARSLDALSSVRELWARVAADSGATLDTAEVVESTDRNAFRRLVAATWISDLPAREAVDALGEGRLSHFNPSGGLAASNPTWAAGLERVAHAVRAVREGAALAVAHGSYGRAGQAQALAVVEGG